MLEKWYVWDGKGKQPEGVKVAICQCQVFIDNSEYLNCTESAQDWFGINPFIKIYTKGEPVERKRGVKNDN